MRLKLSVNAKRSETEKLIDKTVYFTTGAFQMSRA